MTMTGLIDELTHYNSAAKGVKKVKTCIKIAAISSDLAGIYSNPVDIIKN